MAIIIPNNVKLIYSYLIFLGLVSFIVASFFDGLKKGALGSVFLI